MLNSTNCAMQSYTTLIPVQWRPSQAANVYPVNLADCDQRLITQSFLRSPYWSVQSPSSRPVIILSDKSVIWNEISLRRVTLPAICWSNYWIKCHSFLSRVLEWKIKVGEVQVSTPNLCSCRDKSTIIKCSCRWVKLYLLLPLFFIYFLNV